MAQPTPLAQLFQQAVSPDSNARLHALAQLEEFEKQNTAAFIGALCQEISDGTKPMDIRQMAGLSLKNALQAKEEKLIEMKQQRWMDMDSVLKQNVKAMLVSMLPNPEKAMRSTAAQVIGSVAMIELPRNSWPTIVPSLCENITKATDPNLRESSFEALGYVLEQAPDASQEHSAAILTAIGMGMRKEETNKKIKLAATTALANSLEFVKSNMAEERDRNIIMTMVLEATQDKENIQIRVAAYQCIVEICSSYYEYLGTYMPHIFHLSANAIKNEEEDVAKQAIEIWNTICDEEIYILQSIEAGDTSAVCHKFVEQALPQLTPLILEALTKQSEELDDEDEWNVSTAGGVCLGLIAQATTDAIIPRVVPFVEQNIQNANWRYREAAVIAFGCILNGPDPDKLAGWVSNALPTLINLLKDPSAHVKDTAAWTIGRVCENVPEAVEKILTPLMSALVQSLEDIPKVASNVCWAIHNLAEAMQLDDADTTSPLSPYFKVLIQTLLKVTMRPDADQSNLTTSAYEAISSLIHSAAPDMYPLIGELVLPLIEQLNQTLQSNDEKHQEIQGLLCGALQVIIHKLDDKVITPHGDYLMALFLKVLQSKSATIHEAVLNAVGALITKMGLAFERYMQSFLGMLMTELRNSEAYSTCIAAVGVVSELTRALEQKIFPHCDQFMQALLENLRLDTVDRSVKPHIISVMADIAMSIGGEFQRYLPFVMDMLVQASQLKLEPTEDNLEYLRDLHEAILEAYTGILHALSDQNRQEMMLKWMGEIISFLVLVANDPDRDPVVTKGAVGCVGDIATHMAKDPNSRQAILQQPIQNLVAAALADEDEDVKEAGKFATEVLQKLMQGQ